MSSGAHAPNPSLSTGPPRSWSHDMTWTVFCVNSDKGCRKALPLSLFLLLIFIHKFDFVVESHTFVLTALLFLLDRNNSAVLLAFLLKSEWLSIKLITILFFFLTFFLAVTKNRVTRRLLIKWMSPLTRSSVMKTCLPHLGVKWIMVKFRDTVHLKEIVLPHVVLQRHCGPPLR